MDLEIVTCYSCGAPSTPYGSETCYPCHASEYGWTVESNRRVHSLGLGLGSDEEESQLRDWRVWNPRQRHQINWVLYNIDEVDESVKELPTISKKKLEKMDWRHMAGNIFQNQSNRDKIIHVCRPDLKDKLHLPIRYGWLEEAEKCFMCSLCGYKETDMALMITLTQL